MGRKLKKALVFGIVLATVGMVFAATSYKDSWDVPGDLAEWRANTIGTSVQVMDTGGNPGGYLLTESDPDIYYAGALTEKEEFTGDYNSVNQLSVDLNLLNGLENLDGIYIRFRYQSFSYNGWRYLLADPPAVNVWTTYTVTFDPNWTDSEATSAGWLQEETSPSFSETMADVYTAEVRLEGHGPMSAGIDNFSVGGGGSNGGSGCFIATAAYGL